VKRTVKNIGDNMPEQTGAGRRLDFIPYTAPFIVFAIITYAGPALNLPAGITYTLKTVLTGAVLLYFRDHFRFEIQPKFSLTAVFSGVLVFFVWVAPDGLYPHIGHSEFNPYLHASGTNVFLLMAVRLAGASLVVPVMEELFWRSFALRFLVRSDFKSLPLGTFSWFSFIVVAIAFGFEHDRWLVGIAAGMIYAWTLYRSKNLFEPILAHAVTNLLLGSYVILTERWSFW